MRNNEKKNQNSKGVTLVALAVTILVLLILSGITITALLGDNGIIAKAKESKQKTESGARKEEYEMDSMLNDLNNISSEMDAVDINTITTTNHEALKAKDSHGNVVTIPKGFKVVKGETDSEITVQNGVIIEDSAGNQFVWIPIGVVYKNDGGQSNEIKLGRYTFDTTNGTPTPLQLAYTNENPTNYTNESSTIYQELNIARDGVAADGENAQNATAKDLAGFVNSVKRNGGYYIARYEASYGGGYNSSGATDTEKYGGAKPLSKPSTACSEESMNYEAGTLWNFITQLNAAKVARNMYVGNKDANGNNVGVESDLVNSYAWDTAIVYIQEMGNSNYANKKVDISTIKNTGLTNDIVCNIYDMCGNQSEWSTEYSLPTGSAIVTDPVTGEVSGGEINYSPCVSRGTGFTKLSQNWGGLLGKAYGPKTLSKVNSDIDGGIIKDLEIKNIALTTEYEIFEEPKVVNIAMINRGGNTSAIRIINSSSEGTYNTFRTVLYVK